METLCVFGRKHFWKEMIRPTISYNLEISSVRWITHANVVYSITIQPLYRPRPGLKLYNYTLNNHTFTSYSAQNYFTGYWSRSGLLFRYTLVIFMNFVDALYLEVSGKTMCPLSSWIRCKDIGSSRHVSNCFQRPTLDELIFVWRADKTSKYLALQILTLGLWPSLLWRCSSQSSAVSRAERMLGRFCTDRNSAEQEAERERERERERYGEGDRQHKN